MVSTAEITETRPRATVLSTRWLAAGIAAAYLLLALGWGVAVPVGEGPDEPGHFDYALFLAREGRLPVQSADGAAGDVPGEGHQPPLAYWLMQWAVGWLPPAERTLEIGPNPEFWYAGQEANAFLRSSRDIWPYTGIGLAWHLARTLGALLGAATVLLTYALARRCLPGRPGIALGAAALVAFNPQFVFAGALVSNDPLLFTLATALLLVCVVLADEPDAPPRRALGLAAVAGIVLGLALITKQSAVALAPLPFLALALQHGRVSSVAPSPSLADAQRRTQISASPDRSRRLRIPTVVVQGLLIGGVVLAIAGWWYLRNLRLYGDLWGLEAYRDTFAPNSAVGTTLADLPRALWMLFRSSWGVFGPQTIAMSDGVYEALLVFCALGGVGLVAAWGSGWWAGRGRAALLLGAMLVLVSGWTAAFAVLAGQVAWQGRFMFPAIAAVATGLAAGLGAVLPRRSALWTLATLLLVLSVALPRGLLAPRYESYVLPPRPADWGNTRARLSLPWKRGVEIRDVEYASSTRAGEPLDVRITWHVLEQLDARYLVFVHLVDAAGNIAAERDAPPADGHFPTSSWVRGDWIEDTQPVPTAGLAPGTYQVFVGLWNRAEERTLPVVDDAGRSLDWRLPVGTVVVTDR